MGVLGLWQLLEPTGRPTKLQSLEGKTLAIDISIWLYQATKGVRNSSNGHILVLYNRICKLLYFKIKPIFVFDGPNVPKLKQRVLKERQKRKNAAANKAKNLEDKIQKNLLETYILQNVLGKKPEGSDLNQNLPKTSNQAEGNIDDMFILPESSLMKKLDEDSNSNEIDDQMNPDNMIAYEPIDLDEMDPEVFESLPVDIKFELLSEHKKRLKEKKSLSFEQFPSASDDFSSYQMKLLLKKSDVSNKITNLKKSVQSTYLTGTEFEDIYHQKVASEADGEVILFSKKTVSKFTAQNLLDSLHKQKSIETEIDSLAENEIKKEKSPVKDKSPVYRIEFNSDNKIKLVPKDDENAKETELAKIREKYARMEDDNIKKEKSDDVIEKMDDEIELKNEIQKGLDILIKSSNKNQNPDKSDDVIHTSKVIEKKDDGIGSENNKETDSIESSNKLTDIDDVLIDDNDNSVNIVEIDSDKKETPKDNNILNTNQTKFKENESENSIIVVENEENDDTDDDDDFVEVKTVNEIDYMKELIDLTQKETLSSQPSCTSNKENSAQEKNPKINPLLIESNPTEPEIPSNLEEIESYNSYLIQQTNQLIKEKQDSDRLSNSIERFIIDDAKNLLRLFGLPYVDSPGEAEAQCAFLDYTNQTDGSITEDSDVWLFGAKRVYKNFFGSDQFIDYYSDSVIKSQLGLDRDALINVALLVGSDYTEGIEHVGIVKAVEILNEFEGNGMEKLKNFKDWHSKAKENKAKMTKIRSLFTKLELPNSFPSDAVYNAYINPDIDKSTEAFSWSLPELDLIRKYLTKKMGWTIKKIDDDLLPIIKRLNEKKIQKTIENFFSLQTASSISKHSKRMQNALSMFKSKNNMTESNLPKSKIKNGELVLSEDEEEEDQEDNDMNSGSETSKSQSSNKPKTSRTKAKTKRASNALDQDCEIIIDDSDENEESILNKRKSSDSILPTDNKKVKNKPTSKRQTNKKK